MEDFEFDDDSVMSGASLSSTASTANGSPRQAVRLVELGPRMRITLMAVENGLFQGEFLFNLFSKEEKRELDQQRHQEKKIQEMEKKSVQKAEERDAKLEKEYKNMLNEVSRLRDKKKKEKMRKKERLLNNQTQKILNQSLMSTIQIQVHQALLNVKGLEQLLLLILIMGLQ